MSNVGHYHDCCQRRKHSYNFKGEDLFIVLWVEVWVMNNGLDAEDLVSTKNSHQQTNNHPHQASIGVSHL